MKRVFMVLGAVAVIGMLIVTAFAFTVGDETIDGQVTVYLEPVDNPGGLMAAQMSLSALTGAESLQLAFGSIRTAAFTPNYTQNIGPLSKTALYRVWASASIKIAGPELQSIAMSQVIFKGYPSSGVYGTWDTTNYMNPGAGMRFDNALVLNQAIKLDTSAKAKWSTVSLYVVDDSGEYYQTFPLKGEMLNGAVISITVYLRCYLNNGDLVDKVKAVTLQLKVTSWSTAQVSMSMINGSSGV